jgi:zinc and cadmium transporter
MDITLLNIIGLSTLGSVLGLAGGVILLFNPKLVRKASIPLIAFAAGTILATTFLELLPEAIARGDESIFLIILGGLVIFFLLEDFVLHFHHTELQTNRLKSAVPLFLVSDAVHNFIDGVVISAAFLTDPKLGLVVAVATFLHELPQEIGDFAVLLSIGYSRVKTFWFHFSTALTTFAGAVLTFYFFKHSTGLLGPLLALAAGMFLYIASADILPELTHDDHKSIRWQIAGLFLLGILVVFLLIKFIPD